MYLWSWEQTEACSMLQCHLRRIFSGPFPKLYVRMQLCALCTRLFLSIWHLCVQSILASNRGALWDGRSLTPTVESKQERANVSGPAHRTDTLLLSAVSRAEQGRERHTQRNTHTHTGSEWEEESEGDLELTGRARWVVHQGGKSVCLCVCCSRCSVSKYALTLS